MVTELNVLMTFTGGLAAALVFGFFAQKMKVAPMVGYVLAGVAIGPFTPGYVADHHIAENFAEIGVILLLFGVGLRFHLDELFAAWKVAVFGALFQSAASTFLLALALHAAGWGWTSGLVLGMSVSVASTVVLARVLAARGDLRSPIGHAAVAWTVVEDLITVAALLVLPMLLGEGEGRSLGRVFGVAALKVVGLVVAVVVLAKWIIPRAFERIALVRSRELFTLAVLVIALGVAVGSAKLFGVSMALGAFLAGLAVGRSEFAARAAGDALPMRDAFSVLFFVSVGMLCDPRVIMHAPLLIAVIFAVIVLVKPVAAFIVARLLGKQTAVAAGIGAALGQVGEFTFILGSAGRAVGAVDDRAWNALVAAAVLSMAVNPSLYAAVRRLTGGLSRAEETAAPGSVVDPRRCILVGYGPVGRATHDRLQDLGISVTVVELNLATTRALRDAGLDVVYGDALRRTTLNEAGLETAGTLVVSTEIEDAVELVRQARQRNPALRVFVRCSHVSDMAPLRAVGATAIAAEHEVAAALSEAVEETLGRVSDRLLPFPGEEALGRA